MVPCARFQADPATLLTMPTEPDRQHHPWESAEVEVADKMATSLAPYFETAVHLERLAFDLLSSVTNFRQPGEVFGAHCSLLARGLQDLRACSLLTVRGYTMQAWAVAASGFEAIHAMGFIGEDQEKASAWHNHDDLDKSQSDVFSAVRRTLVYLGLVQEDEDLEARTQEEYTLYRQMCVGKHVNPAAERYRYLDPESESLILSPVFSQNRVREAKLGIATIARGVSMGIWMFRKAHLEPSNTEFDARIIDVSKQTRELALGLTD